MALCLHVERKNVEIPAVHAGPLASKLSSTQGPWQEGG